MVRARFRVEGAGVRLQPPQGDLVARLGTLGRARWWGEDAARDPRGPGWRELAGTFGCPLGGSGTDVAVRQ